MIAASDGYLCYLDALRERGIPAGLELVADRIYKRRRGAALQRLLHHKPDAVFVANDTMTMAAMRVIWENGLRAGGYSCDRLR